MKKILSMLFLLQTLVSFGQCINLYVKEHYSGDPICNLYPESELEICFDEKTVSGGSCNFYIMKVRNTYNGMSIDLALDNVYYAQKYAELMINTKTQNFGFIIGNNSGTYSYYSEFEMEQKRELEEARRIEEQNIKQEEDKVTKTKVEAYLNTNNLDYAITEFNKMNFVDRTLKSRIDSEIEKRNIDEDSKRNSTIESLLNTNQVDLAVEEFKKLHNSNDNLKQKLQNAINQNYEKQSLVLQTDILKKIVSDNNTSFSKLKDGKYNIVLNKEGLVTAESIESNSKSQICSNKIYLKKNGFEYPATYSGEVSISTDKIKMNAGDSTRYVVAEKYKKKDIYISKKGEFYLGRFGAPLSSEMSLKPSFYSDDVHENNINSEQLYKYTRNANGIKIEEGKGYFVEKTIIAKKGTGRKIFRIITSPIWGPFYLYFLASR